VRRLLDLFCGAGGAAMGYHWADFEVVGVDKEPMPRYPFEFHQADALHFLAEHWRDFDVIHASPPCQTFARVTAWRGDRASHPDLLGATRGLLRLTGLPHVIENVPEAPLRRDALLCGSQFGLRVKRHRVFESNVSLFALLPECRHVDLLPFTHKGERAFADAMGCTWMSNREARQAIPPAYTEFLGAQLLAHLESEAA
jgi:DNA (cytosine-5)-methyltransferase 1